MAKLSDIVKYLMLWSYVYLWAPLRNAVRALSGQAHVVILTYHRVSDNYEDNVTVGTDQFRRQLGIVKRRCRILDMAIFLSQRGQCRRRTCAVITFDDGYADNYEAAKALREESIPCTFFLSTGIVGSARSFNHDIERLGKGVPVLSWPQVREMAQWGFRFGNHTAGHANIGQMNMKEAVSEIQAGIEDLRRELGQMGDGAWLAYPFGRLKDISDEIRAMLPKLGIEFCFSACGGTNPPSFDKMNILRQGVNHEFSDLAFKALLEGWRVRT